MISKDRMKRTSWSARLCARAGLSYHVIDSEWKMFYLMPYEAQELIAQSRGLKTIVTFSSRHYNSLRLLRQTLNGLGTLDAIGLNLVVGNPAYLTEREIRRPSIRTLVDSIRFVRRYFKDLTVFIGAEGLISKAAQLSVEYDLIPFLLLDRGLEDDLATVRDFVRKSEIALYAPFLISENYPRLLHDILFRLSGYIMRRSWVRGELKKLGYDLTASTLKAVIQDKKPLPTKLMRSNLGIFLKKAASSLTLYGNMKEVTERINHIRMQGVTTVIGLPIKENEQQILSFGKCVSKSI
ncbi:MAG: hypothetical protein OEZ25_04810 [Candidatus Bathyarchaeota archaeon]|nr:hypothetical protein [Candidatus Bathyarchaeota archaeon]